MSEFGLDLGGVNLGLGPTGADAATSIGSAGAGFGAGASAGTNFFGGLSGLLPSNANQLASLGLLGVAGGSAIAGLAGGETAEERRLRQLAQAQQQQSAALTAQTEPLRAAATQRILAALDPNTPVNVSPARDALERQFRVARQRTIEGSTARGGQLANALTGLESNRAVGVGNLEQSARDQALSQALQVGFGVGPSAASASTNAALGAFTNLNQIATQRETAAGSALGQSAALAALFSMKGNK